MLRVGLPALVLLLVLVVIVVEATARGEVEVVLVVLMVVHAVARYLYIPNGSQWCNDYIYLCYWC